MPVDINSIKKTDLGALIAGGLAFILSLIGSYLSFSVDVPEEAESFGVTDDSGGLTNAWESYATLGMLLVLLATAIIAVKVFAPQLLPAGVPFNLVAAAAAGLGTLLLILRALTYSEGGSFIGYESSVGPGWSGWALFLAAIALTAFAALGFRDSGEKVPWNTQGSTAGGTGYSAPTGNAGGGYQSAPPSAQMPPPPGGAPTAPPAAPGGQAAPPPPPPMPPSSGEEPPRSAY